MKWKNILNVFKKGNRKYTECLKMHSLTLNSNNSLPINKYKVESIDMFIR